MRSKRLRSMVTTAVLVALFGLGFYYLAPAKIGGWTTYVVTRGISMEPLFHTGDLVLVRPEDNYKVGQVVAYHSTLLHTVVLHRIVGRAGNRYIFKGDNNNFLDPTRPTKALLIGAMWLHVAHGGLLIAILHQPWVGALLFAAVAAFLLFGGGRRRRRRDRGRRSDGRSRRVARVPPVTSLAHPARRENRYLFAACVAGAVLFAVLAIIAFVRPADRTRSVTHTYKQALNFGYHANVRPSPVYPSGTVSTGDPVYTGLVHALTVTAAYRLTAAAPSRLHGTIGIRATLSNTSGWSRSFWLAHPSDFVGANAHATARLDLARFEALTSRISAQIGAGAGGSYNLAVIPQVKIKGTIAGQHVSASYSPTLNVGVGPSELLGGSSAIAPAGSSGGSAQSGLVRSTAGTATAVRTTFNTFAGVPVSTIRWLALLLCAVFAAAAFLVRRRDHDRVPDPAERIHTRYKHLIVPIEPITPSTDHPPIEVSSIDALAQLAERSERLILHDHRDDVDNYLIDDQGTLYQFSAPRVSERYASGTGSANGTGRPRVAAAVRAVWFGKESEAEDSDVVGSPGAPSITTGGPGDPLGAPSRAAGDPGGAADGPGGATGVPGDAAGGPGDAARGRTHPDRPTEPLGATAEPTGDPVADAAAAIFRSAAASLSAAATSATVGRVAPADDRDKPEDAGPASARNQPADADQAGGTDRPGDPLRPGMTDTPGDADRTGGTDGPGDPDQPSGTDRRAGPDWPGGTDRRGRPASLANPPWPGGTDRRRGTDRRGSADPLGGTPPPGTDRPGGAGGPAAAAPMHGASSTAGDAASTGSAPAAEETQAGGRPVPDILVFDAEAPQPPIAAPGRWSNRPEVRAGFALGPLALCFLAWRRLRAKRRRIRGDDYYEEQRAARRPWTTRNLPRR